MIVGNDDGGDVLGFDDKVCDSSQEDSNVGAMVVAGCKVDESEVGCQEAE